MESEAIGGLAPWFRLRSVPGIGNYLFKRLMDRFQSPDRVFQAPREELLQVDGISNRLGHFQTKPHAVFKVSTVFICAFIGKRR